jgi:hypothetical protein
MFNGLVRMGRAPGELYIEGYGTIRAVSWDEGYIYDTVTFTASGGAIAAGTEYTFFRDITNKNERQTNMTLSSQLPSGWEMIVLKVGFHIPVTVDVTDMNNILHWGYTKLLLDNTFIAREGLPTMFQGGYGMWGQVSVGHTAAATATFFNNGLSSPASVPNLRIPIIITDKRTFKGTWQTYDALTMSGASVEIQCAMYLYGFIRQPAQ